MYKIVRKNYRTKMNPILDMESQSHMLFQAKNLTYEKGKKNIT